MKKKSTNVDSKPLTPRRGRREKNNKIQKTQRKKENTSVFCDENFRAIISLRFGCFEALFEAMIRRVSELRKFHSNHHRDRILSLFPPRFYKKSSVCSVVAQSDQCPSFNSVFCFVYIFLMSFSVFVCFSFSFFCCFLFGILNGYSLRYLHLLSVFSSF